MAKKSTKKITSKPKNIQVSGLLTSITKSIFDKTPATVCLENRSNTNYTFLDAKQARKMAAKLIEIADYIEA